MILLPVTDIYIKIMVIIVCSRENDFMEPIIVSDVNVSWGKSD